MSEQPVPHADTVQIVRDRLEALGQRLRGAQRLSPEAREELAVLVDELATALDPSLSSDLAAHLVETSEHLSGALDADHDESPLAAARLRLDAVAAGAESKAPVLSGVVRRLVDALANIGT
jgi:hypothetical protein